MKAFNLIIMIYRYKERGLNYSNKYDYYYHTYTLVIKDNITKNKKQKVRKYINNLLQVKKHNK